MAVEQAEVTDSLVRNSALSAARSIAYDITKQPLTPENDGAVRVDYVNSENPSAGYSYRARWFDYDAPLTIHVRTGYDDVIGV